MTWTLLLIAAPFVLSILGSLVATVLWPDVEEAPKEKPRRKFTDEGVAALADSHSAPRHHVRPYSVAAGSGALVPAPRLNMRQDRAEPLNSHANSRELDDFDMPENFDMADLRH